MKVASIENRGFVHALLLIILVVLSLGFVGYVYKHIDTGVASEQRYLTPSCTASATKTVVLKNEPFTVTWDARNGDAAYAHGYGSVDVNGSIVVGEIPPEGFVRVSGITNDTTYTYDFYAEDGQKTCTTNVSVAVSGSLTFSSYPATVTLNQGQSAIATENDTSIALVGTFIDLTGVYAEITLTHEGVSVVRKLYRDTGEQTVYFANQAFTMTPSAVGDGSATIILYTFNPF